MTTPDPACLQRLPDVEAEIWVDPSPEHWFWVRHFGPWFAPTPGRESWLARWLGIVFVVPLTNVTNLSLQYQAYLNEIFHTTAVARGVHSVCIPIITALVLAALEPLQAGPFDGTDLGALGLSLWYVAWALREGSVPWALASVAAVGGMYTLASTLHFYEVSPWPWLVLLPFVQAASHGAEPMLPPRVTRSPLWVHTSIYVMQATGGGRLARIGHLVGQAAFGTLDELIASPRLLPVYALDALWRLGYRSSWRARWVEMAERAVRSGNPALDYIGTGGGTTLRWVR